MTLRITIDSSEYTKGLKRFKATLFPQAARETLNSVAKFAAFTQKNQLRRDFHLRNRWSEGSIVPSRGRNYGLIPPHKTDLSKMHSFSGTRQPYLADQESGYSRKDPSIPHYGKARKGGAFSGRVRPFAKMRKMKSRGVKRVRDYDLKGKSAKTRTRQLIAMLSRENYRGFIRLYDSDGWTPGYYRLTKRRVDFIRSRRFERKSYRARPWHAPAIARATRKPVYDALWAKHAKRALSKL